MVYLFNNFSHGAVIPRCTEKLSHTKMSGRIRQQLGPVKKRVADRLLEAKNVLSTGVVNEVKDFRVKLIANIASMEKLTNVLVDVVDNT